MNELRRIRNWILGWKPPAPPTPALTHCPECGRTHDEYARPIAARLKHVKITHDLGAYRRDEANVFISGAGFCGTCGCAADGFVDWSAAEGRTA